MSDAGSQKGKTAGKTPSKPAKPKAPVPVPVPVEVATPAGPAFAEAVVTWALAQATGGDAHAARALVEAAPSPARAEVRRCFGLGEKETELVDLLYARERSFELGGLWADGLTVERARRILGAHVDGLLSPAGALRRHALVELESAGWPAADERLRLGSGLAARLDGATGTAERDGVTLVAAPFDESWALRFAPSTQVLNIVPRATGEESQLLYVSACGRRDALAFAVELADRAQHNLLVVDGTQVGRERDVVRALAALRRDAELDQALLLVHDVAAVGDAWQVLCRAPAVAAHAPLLVVVADARPVEMPGERLVLAALRPRPLTLAPTLEKPEKVDIIDVNKAEAAAANAVPGGNAAPLPVDDSFDEIRKRAQRDAERALGVYKEAHVRHPIPPPKQRPAVVAPVGYEQSVAAMKGAPSGEKLAVEKPAEIEKSTEPEKFVAKVETVTKTEKPKEAAAAPKYSAKAMQHVRKAQEPARATPAAQPVAPVATVAFEPSGVPPVAVPENAGPRQWSQIAQTSPSPEQRIELLGRLREHRGSEVVAALRANAKSEHPGVRAAAEAGMQALFGPSWNATRAVAKPVQPPRSSDDDDRGPPGGLGGR